MQGIANSTLTTPATTKSSPEPPQKEQQRSSLRAFLLGTRDHPAELSSLPSPDVLVSPIGEPNAYPELLHPVFRDTRRWPDLSLRGAGQNNVSQGRVQTGQGPPQHDAQSPVSPVPDGRQSGDQSSVSSPWPLRRRDSASSAFPAPPSSHPSHHGNSPDALAAPSSTHAISHNIQQPRRPLPYPLSPTSPKPPQQQQQSQQPSKRRDSSPPPPFEGWTATPGHLNQTSKFDVLFAVGDAIMAFAPIAFIVLGICVVRLDGQRVEGNKFGKDIQRTMDLGPTLFPIMFAAVAGKALKVTARFCAERGAKLGTLELLMANQTVWGTFESQVLLKNLSVVGAHLFVLWALSPIGGQASLRVLEYGNATTTDKTRVVYFPTGRMQWNQSKEGVFTIGDESSIALTQLNALYNAVVVAPENRDSSQRSLWGNVRVPRIDLLNQVPIDGDGWISVPDTIPPDHYSSLVGIPVAGIPSTDQATFEITSSYMEFNCPVQMDFKLGDDAPANSWKQTLASGEIWGSQGAFPASDIVGNSSLRTQTTFFLDTHTPFTEARQTQIFFNPNYTLINDQSLQDRRNILFGAFYWPEDANYIIMRNCDVTNRFVDVFVNCVHSSCAAQKIRQSVSFGQRNPLITPLDDRMAAANLMKSLPRATGPIHHGHSIDGTLSEKYIRGGAAAFNPNRLPPPLPNVTVEEFNARFTKVMNTYHQLSQGPFAFTSNPDVSEFGPHGNSTFENGTFMGLPGNPFTSLSAPWYGMPTMSSNSVFHTVYQCDFFWLAMLEASAGILLCVGIAGLAMKIRCKAPEMLGYVASMTYDNPYVDLPPGGNVFSAMERAQRLRRLDVRIGDVKPDQKVGHVAFASLQGNAAIGTLQKDRLYV